jgi:NitT/TauT family transport system substrate-binding protein
VHAVAAGRYDVCLTSVAHFLRAKAEDARLSARFVFMVARRPHLAAFVVEGRPAAHGRPIESFADLDGASVLASPESGLGREYGALLSTLGAEAGPPVESRRTFAALAAGEADVGLEFLEMLPRYEAAARKQGVSVRALPFYEAGLDVYGSGLVVGHGLIEVRPDVVHRIVGAVAEGLAATRDDPWPGAEAMRAQYRGVDPSRAVASWETGHPLVFFDEELGAMDAAGWERTISHHAVVHGTPSVPADEVFDASFAPTRVASGAPL